MKSTQANTRKRNNAMNVAHTNRHNDAEWRRREEMCKRAWLNYVEIYGIPDDIPVRPDLVYADEGWRGWQDFLGMGKSDKNRGQQ